MEKNISDKVINRLTLYHCILADYINENIEFISSKQIASLLKIDDSQVRKDINLLNNTGKSRVGYIVKELKKSIEAALSFSKTKKAFIIGAGNLLSFVADFVQCRQKHSCKDSDDRYYYEEFYKSETVSFCFHIFLLCYLVFL